MTKYKITISLFLLISLALTSYVQAHESIIHEPDSPIHFEVEIIIQREWLRLRVITEEPISLEGLELRPINGSRYGIPANDFDVLSGDRLAQNNYCYFYRSNNSSIDPEDIGCDKAKIWDKNGSFWLVRNNRINTIEVYWYTELQDSCQEGTCTIRLQQVMNRETIDEFPPSEPVIDTETNEPEPPLILNEVINTEEYLDFINELIIGADFIYFPEDTYHVEIDGTGENIEVNAFIINRHPVELENFNNYSDNRIHTQALLGIAETSLARTTYLDAEEYCTNQHQFDGFVSSAKELFVSFSMGNLSQDILEVEGFNLMGFYEEWSSTERVDGDIQTVILNDDYSLSTYIRPRTYTSGLITFRCVYPVPNHFNLSGEEE